MDEVIDLLETNDGLPKIHRLAMLVAATAVGFLANEVTKKVYIGAFQKLHNK